MLPDADVISCLTRPVFFFKRQIPGHLTELREWERMKAKGKWQTREREGKREGGQVGRQEFRGEGARGAKKKRVPGWSQFWGSGLPRPRVDPCTHVDTWIECVGETETWQGQFAVNRLPESLPSPPPPPWGPRPGLDNICWYFTLQGKGFCVSFLCECAFSINMLCLSRSSLKAQNCLALNSITKLEYCWHVEF